ncbi:G_PROTEIN_RECEP_F1_2 domain-containing protein, partial [Meloidogyne graminicola]
MLIQTTNNNSTTNKSIDFNIKLSNTLTTNLMENDSDIQINNQEESGGHEYLFVLPFIVLFGLC